MRRALEIQKRETMHTINVQFPEPDLRFESFVAQSEKLKEDLYRTVQQMALDAGPSSEKAVIDLSESSDNIRNTKLR